MNLINPPSSLAVVLNVKAGRGLAGRYWPRLEQELRHRHLPFELIQTSCKAEALERVQALPQDAWVMAAGGDGTVAALLPALMGVERSLMMMPLGSGNDFAGMLGLRPGDFATALDRISHVPRHVDVLEVQIVAGDLAGTTRASLNGMGMGFDAEVDFAIESAPEQLKGFFRYLWGALATLGRLKLRNVQIWIDDQPLYQGPSCLAAIMNGKRYGGGFMISPDSDAQDGQLNVLASGPVSRWQLLGLMAQVLPGRHLNHSKVNYGVGTEAQIRWEQPVFMHLDGDVSGEVEEVRVRVLPGAVKLLNG